MGVAARTQPQGLVRINRSNPLTRGLVLAALPSLGLRNGVTGAAMSAPSMPSKVSTSNGIAFDVVRGTVNPINTGVVPSSQAHSYFAFVNMTDLGNSNSDVFISSFGTTTRGGFDFGLASGGIAGTAPNRTFLLRTVYDGVGNFGGSVPVSGLDGKFGSVGFSHGSGLRHYANGALLETPSSTPVNMTMIGQPLQLHENVYWPYGPLNARVAIELYWTRELSAAEMAAVHANPWQLFDATSQTQFPKASVAVGPLTFSYSSTGGIVVSGTLPFNKGKVTATTGGLSYSGTSPKVKGKATTGSGGVVFSGTIAKAIGRSLTALGGLVLSGTGGAKRGRSVSPTGGLTFSGIAAKVRGAARAVAGGLQLAGNAMTSFSNQLQSRIITPIVGVVIGSATVVGKTLTIFTSGGMNFGGASSIMKNGLMTVIGTISDVMYKKLVLRGGNGGSINDMINENIYWRALAGGSMKPLNDVKFIVLSGMGYTGSLNDMEKKYWENL